VIYVENKNILKSIDTEFVVDFDDENEAEIVYNSISPEIEYEDNDRSKAIISLKDNSIVINIKSKDIVSLRASINSYIRWINLSIKILKI